MKRGKRAVLFAVCAVVVAAFALTGCGDGGETKGAQVTKEQFSQVLSEMLDAFPSDTPKNAAMSVEISDLKNFYLSEVQKTTVAGQTLSDAKIDMQVDNKKVKINVDIQSGDFFNQAEIYAAELNQETWLYENHDGVWNRRSLQEIDGTPFSAIRNMFSTLKDAFDSFSFKNGKYVSLTDKTPGLIRKLYKIGQGAEGIFAKIENASIELEFQDVRLKRIALIYSTSGNAQGASENTLPGATVTDTVEFSNYGKASVKLPSVQ